MIRKISFKLLCAYLVAAVVVLSLPAQGWAMFIPSGQDARGTDLAKIQTALETTVVKQRLTDLGLSNEEAMTRMKMLNDEQIHQFASKLDSVQAGADTVGTLLFILLLGVIVVGVLELTGHSIILR